MTRPIVRFSLAAIVACFLPAAASAAPFMLEDNVDVLLEDNLGGDVLILNARRYLTYEDLLVLAGRDDAGWHLGWFKDKGWNDVEGPGPMGLQSGFTPLFSWPTQSGVWNMLTITGFSGGVSTPGAAAYAGGGAIGLDLDLVATNLDLVAIPEPATVLLVGMGLLAVARRRIRRKP